MNTYKRKMIVFAVGIVIVLGLFIGTKVIYKITEVKNEKSVLDKIKESPVARLELPDGNSVYVDGEIAVLHGFADLELMESAMEPADESSDWIYRIIFNPSERVKGNEEIVVSVHKEYVQINSEFYLAKQGVSFAGIIEWMESKFDMFMQ